MSERLNRLDKVATDWGLDNEMTDPVRWLTKQIKSGRITARKIGRHWYMTSSDMEAAVEAFASKQAKPIASDELPVRGGLSAASMRRRIA